MPKDRAAPFSKKHRRYWIPVTGGMVVIGIINILIGLHSYKPPQDVERMELPALHRDAGQRDAAGTIGNAELPAAVMRAFAVKYPQTLPTGAQIVGTNYVISFPVGGAHAHATYSFDGTFVSED